MHADLILPEFSKVLAFRPCLCVKIIREEALATKEITIQPTPIAELIQK